jgi:DNA invertase Pin-like site-specific DNA recombinase
MMGVFAEFERAMIRERVKSGLERARAQGKTLGRKRIDARKEAAILADLRSRKAGIIKLAAAHGVGVGTVQRIKAGLTRRNPLPRPLGDSLAALGPCCSS